MINLDSLINVFNVDQGGQRGQRGQPPQATARASKIVLITEVLDQDGETWIKTDLLDPDPPGYLALVALGGADALLGRERLRLPCGAVLQILNVSVPFNGVVDLLSPGHGRPPHLEVGMVLEVVL